ncbi:MAG: hypothetical protein Q9182_001360 [Xanthomendoza sp. 2 TL-2023]
MAPYPSVHQIEEIFLDGEAGPDLRERFASYFDPKIQMTILGEDHHAAGEHQGSDSVKDDHFGLFMDVLDLSKPNKVNVQRVIGGGESPWACVEIFFDGKTKAGKKFHHECCFVVRFNEAGKMTKLRAYYDTAHLNHHYEAHTEYKSKNATNQSS